MNFGVEFSELFLDSSEKAGDIQSKINLHNNHVGRMVSDTITFQKHSIHIQFWLFYRLLRIICRFDANVMVCRGVVN